MNFYFTFCFKKGKKYRCGFNSINFIPKAINKTLPIKNNHLNAFNYPSSPFKSLSIYLDLFQFNDEINKYNLNDKKTLFTEALNKAIKTLQKLLNVRKQYYYDLFTTDEDIISLGIYEWNKEKIGNKAVKGLNSLGIDLYIFVKFGNKTEMGEETLASGFTGLFDKDSLQPKVGVVTLNKDVEYSKEKSSDFLQSIILHEITHILGFNSFYFKNFSIFGYFTTNENGIIRPYLKSPKLLNVARKYYNCSNIKGIQLEESGGEGTFGSHWEERILLGEYMNGFIYPEEQIISEFTLAVLEDSGFYQANYYTGGLMRFGKNKGCDFLNLKCVNNGIVNPKFKNEYFDLINIFEPSCSSGRQSRTYKNLTEYYFIFPEEYRYFYPLNIGGRKSSDFCPVFSQDEKEAENEYYVGHCSTKGSGKYGSHNLYTNSEGKEFYYNNGDMASKTGEKNTYNSFCALSSLISKNIENSEFYSKTVRATCYEMYCSSRSLTIKINDDYFVCPRSGGKIKVINYDGYILCPDYNLMCSGSVLCNDMFDCVEKDSLLKEVTYDYTIKTTQDLIEAENEEFSEDNYELSSDGKCPQYCIQCILNRCITCTNNYYLAEYKENNLIKRNCKSLKELEHGYFKNETDSLYYKCIDNCDVCSNVLECTICNSDSFIRNKKCIKNIEFCISYDENGICIKCENKYELYNNECNPIRYYTNRKTDYIMIFIILVINLICICFCINQRKQNNLRKKITYISFKKEYRNTNNEDLIHTLY